MWRQTDLNKYMPYIPTHVENYNEIYSKNNWIKSDGSIIKINDMDNDHLRNSINMVERYCVGEGIKANKYRVVNNLINELLKRGV